MSSYDLTNSIQFRQKTTILINAIEVPDDLNSFWNRVLVDIDGMDECKYRIYHIMSILMEIRKRMVPKRWHEGQLYEAYLVNLVRLERFLDVPNGANREMRNWFFLHGASEIPVTDMDVVD